MNEPKPLTPKYYRLLEKGEIIEKGDYKVKLPEQVMEVRTEYIGKEAGYPLDPTFRPVICDEWIEYSKRKPTKEDFEPTDRIQVYYGAGTGLILELPITDPSNQFTHWRKITPPQPAKPKAIVLRMNDGRAAQRVIPQPDGSVKLDCGDVISAESIDAFILARNEVTKKDLV